jgi:hypothetical protein
LVNFLVVPEDQVVFKVDNQDRVVLVVREASRVVRELQVVCLQVARAVVEERGESHLRVVINI